MIRAIQDAFHRLGPFAGSGDLSIPVPRPPRRFWRARRPLNDALTPPWGFADSPPFHSGVSPTSRRLFARLGHRRFTADNRSELGLRSLSPLPFLEHCAGAYSRPNAANRLLQLHNRRTGTATRVLVFLAGTETAISFLFLRITHGLPCGSGDARRAALRPFASISVPVPLACASLPDRDTNSNAPPPLPCDSGV